LLGRGKGLSAQDIEYLLKNGTAYQRAGDIYYSITGRIRRAYYTIVFNPAAGNELVTIFKRGFPDLYDLVHNPFR